MDYVIVDVICENMPVLTSEDKALIKVLRVEKGWTVDRMMCEFPARQWNRQTLYDLVRKNDQTGTTDRLTGSGQRHSVRTAANIRNIKDLICSQEGQPGTSKSPREISRETGTSRSSVQRIAKRDLKLMAVRTERRRPLPVNVSVVPVWSFFRTKSYNVRLFHCLAGNSHIMRSTVQPFSTRKNLINALSSEVSTGMFTQMTSTIT